MFAARPSVARTHYSIFGLGLFLYNMVIIVYFSFVYLMCTKGNRYQKIQLMVISFISISLYFLLLYRFHLIMTFILILIFLYYATRHVNIKTIMIFLFIGLITFYSISGVRGGVLGTFCFIRLHQCGFQSRWRF